MVQMESIHPGLWAIAITCACQLSRLEFDNVLRVRLPMIVDDELSVHLAATCIGHDAVEREPL